MDSIVEKLKLRTVYLDTRRRFPFSNLIEYLAWIRINRREYTPYVAGKNLCTATRFDCALESSQVTPFVFWA